jgi:antitoxin HicB
MKGDMMPKNRKPRVSKETLDEFLAQQGILGTCEERAIEEIIAAQLAEAIEAKKERG